MNIYLIDSPDWHTVGLILGVLLIAGAFYALGGIVGLGRGYREGLVDGEAKGDAKNAELLAKLEQLGQLAAMLQLKLDQTEPAAGSTETGLRQSVREGSQAPDARSYDGTAAGTRIEDELPGYQPDERVGKVIGALRHDFMPSSGDVIPIPPYLHEPKAGHHIVIYVGNRSGRFLLGEPFFRQSGDRKVLSAGITEVGGRTDHAALTVHDQRDQMRRDIGEHAARKTAARDARIADLDKTLADHAASTEPTEPAEAAEEPKQYYMSTGIPAAEPAQTERVAPARFDSFRQPDGSIDGLAYARDTLAWIANGASGTTPTIDLDGTEERILNDPEVVHALHAHDWQGVPFAIERAIEAQTERVEDPAKPGAGGLDRPRFDRT